MPVAAREDAALVTVSVLDVDGTAVSLGTFESRTGGDTDSQETTVQMGGIGVRRALGGQQTPVNVVVQGLYTDDRAARIKWLRSRVGKGTNMIVTESRQDGENVAVGDPQVWRCVLKRVKSPDFTSSNANPGMLEMEGTVDGSVG